MVLDDVLRDPGLLEAHDLAVRVALEHLARFGATTRIRVSERRLHPDTAGLSVATLRQATSRADDPQLHTHAVISAKVQTDDGRWWALDARYLKRNQRMLGGLYQSVLRAELSHRYGVGWEAMVNGQADLAVAFPASTLIEIAGGSEQKIVAEIIQVNNAALVVPADSPVESPADLAGKAYGGYGTSHEKPIVTQVIAGAGAENPDFKEVVLQTGAIEALTSGQVDFSSVYEGWSEIGAEIAGTPLKSFRYGDYVEGYTYPDVVFVASDEAIETKADLLRRGLAALAEGYAFAAESPAETVTIYPGKSAECVLAFAAPPPAARDLELELPAIVFDGTDPVRFRLPRPAGFGR